MKATFKVKQTKNGKTKKVFMWHATENEYQDHESDNGGGCVGCGELAYGVEPDARAYECECCGAQKVYGIAELLMGGRINIEG